MFNLFLLLSSPALANTTGDIRFYYAQSSVVPDGVRTLVARDDVRRDASPELLRLLSFDAPEMAVDVLPPSAGPSSCAGGADGYLVLQALDWSTVTRAENVLIADHALSVTDDIGRVTTTSSGNAWQTTGQRDLHVGTSHGGVRVIAMVTGDAAWEIVDCVGKPLKSWTHREVVTVTSEGDSESEARARLDVDAARLTAGVAAMARGARQSLSRTRADRVTRTLFDAGSPELEAAAGLLHRSRETEWEPSAHIWSQIAAGPANTGAEARNAARARYNLALEAERSGAFAEAAQLAGAADAVLHLDWIAAYVAEMDAMANTSGRPIAPAAPASAGGAGGILERVTNRLDGILLR